MIFRFSFFFSYLVSNSFLFLVISLSMRSFTTIIKLTFWLFRNFLASMNVVTYKPRRETGPANLSPYRWSITLYAAFASFSYNIEVLRIAFLVQKWTIERLLLITRHSYAIERCYANVVHISLTFAEVIYQHVGKVLNSTLLTSFLATLLTSISPMATRRSAATRESLSDRCASLFLGKRITKQRSINSKRIVVTC